MKYGRYIFIVFIMSLIPGPGVRSQEQKAGPVSPSARLDKLLEDMDRQDRPAGAVIVVQEGNVVYRKCFGLANLEYGVPTGLKTVFDLGPLSRMVTGMAAAMLEEKGQLVMDDDIRKLLPELPVFNHPVTWRDVVSHSSGLPSWEPFLQLSDHSEEAITTGYLLRFLQAQTQLRFTPGSKNQYSSTDYFLIAEAVRRVTGRPLRDWAWDNIFKPLKMTRTLFRDNCREIIENRAYSYNYSGRDGYLKGADNLSITGSHNLFATIEDLTRWMQNLDTGQTGGRPVIAKMTSPAALRNGQPGTFGYAFQTGEYKGLKRAFLEGQWGGFISSFQYFPEERLSVAILTNWDYNFHQPSYFLPEILETFLAGKIKPDQPVAAPPEKEAEVKIEPSRLEQYAGHYRLSGRERYTFATEDGQLKIEAGGSRYPFTPRSETEFFLKVASITVIFQKEADGRVTGLIWKEPGEEDRTAVRFEYQPAAGIDFPEFCGKYSRESTNARFTVEYKENRLVLSHPKYGEMRLAPEAKDHFICASALFPMLIFSRDGNNRITGFTIAADDFRDIFLIKQPD